MSKKDVIASGSFSVEEILGKQIARDEILNIIQNSNVVNEWNSFIPEDQEKLLLFLEGKKGLQILNDRFYKKVFNPEIFPERLESFISSVMGERVTIERILSREGTRIAEIGSQVIMDIVVRTESGAMVSVEMQRIGYLFPGERTSCYISDMVMRQYQTVRAERGKEFSYRDLKPVTLIVIMEKSSDEFRKVAPKYLHRKNSFYDSGVKVTDLENVIYISLDTFRERSDNIVDSELVAWLTFFSQNDTDEIIKLVKAYPQFIPMYKDIADFRNTPEEVISMFSEELRIMDRNTTKYMIDQIYLRAEKAEEKLEEAVIKRDEAVAELDKTTSKLEETEARCDKAESERDEAYSERDKAVAEADRFRALLEANGIQIPKE